MLKNFFRILPFLAIVLVAVGCNNKTASTEEVYVSKCKASVGDKVVVLKDGSFEPKTTSVKLCTKVTFKNEGSQPHWPASDLHPTHGIYPEFDPQQSINPGNSWSFIFDKVGNWKCHDHLNPSVRCEVDVTQ